MSPGFRSASIVTIVLASCLIGCAAPSAAPGRVSPDGLGPRASVITPPPVTGLTTMYFRDPLACRMSFATGAEGGVFQDHMTKNHQSDIDFGHYVEGAFRVGVEGGSRGAIVDLGTPAELRERYGFSDTVGGGQAFASIRWDGDGFRILADYETQATQPLREADGLLDAVGVTESAPVVTDHVYLVALSDRHDPTFRRLVKFHVVAHVPGESVTLRWYRLDG